MAVAPSGEYQSSLYLSFAPQYPRGYSGGGFRGSQIEKYVEAVKRLDRLAPNLAHMCRFICEWIYAKQIALRDTRRH